jgi:fucose-binding lectin
MSGQGCSAVEQSTPDYHGFVRPRTALRYWLLGLSVVALLLCIASAASAANIYWYGENNSTCWQTGFPGNPSHECDTVGAGYLPSGHMRNGAIGADVELINSGVSGDYCNYYHLNEGLDTTNENEQGRFTGFNPPTPYGSYQEGNHYNPPDVCQADGTTWGQVVRGNSSNSKCEGSYAPCGMQHFVSLGAQGTKDQPWSLNQSSLAVSGEEGEQVLEAPNSWGYLCPLLKSPSGAIIEYCLEQWHVGSGSFPAYKHFDEAGPCNFGGGQVFTGFASGTKFAELVAGSSETFEVKGNPTKRTMTARITLGDLEAAVAAVETHGCGLQSHSFREYALIGIEQGIEGGGLTMMGATTAHLQAWSEYTLLPPEATTEASSGLEQAEVTLNGKVNPRGSEAKSHFEYGLNTSYGKSTTPEGDPGSGWSQASENATIIGLAPCTTYHYRIVATNAVGSTPGSDQTFTTPCLPRVYFVSKKDGKIHELGYNNGWAESAALGESEAATGTSPSAFLNTNGLPRVYFVSKKDNKIHELGYNAGKWTESSALTKAEVSKGTNLSSFAYPEGGVRVYFVSKEDNKIHELGYNNGGGWAESVALVGSEAAPETAPSAFLNTNGLPRVYFVSKKDSRIHEIGYNAGKWAESTALTAEVAKGTSLSSFAYPEGCVRVYFVSKETDKIRELGYNTGSGWTENPALNMESEVATGTGLSAFGL